MRKHGHLKSVQLHINILLDVSLDIFVAIHAAPAQPLFFSFRISNQLYLKLN